MAGADQVVCPFFGVVYERLNNLIYKDQKELGPLVGLVKELKKLFRIFLKIKEVLDDAEEKQFNEKAIRVRFWLQELNDAAYEADDVFDEFEYEALQQLDSEGATSSSSNDVTEQLNGKIQKLIEDFRELAEECSGLELQKEKEKSVVVSPDRITISLLDEPQVYGRDEDREKLVKQILGSAYLTLLEFRTRRSNYWAKSKHPTTSQGPVLNNVSGSSEDTIFVFSILGMGGVGKTTLAQLIYNDERVQDHFNSRSWVCVSDDFDIKRLMNAIVATILGNECNLEDLELLQRHLQEVVHGKRFLLVLDDVWEESQEKWNKLKSSFRGGAQGSSVIVTTRLPTVASITSKFPPHRLNGLLEEDCWDLFKQYAFGPGNEEREALVNIGKAIVKKCGGLPLAAKAMGGLLRFKNEENEWNEVKDSAIWELPESSVKGILPALRLSYYHLSSTLKQCFVYCSIFPKDFNIKRERLTQLWMANGLVQSRAKIELEDVANEIFNTLLQRSFFQDVEKDEYGNIIECKMHDLVHDLASYIGGDEYFAEDAGNAKSIIKRNRYVSLLYERREVSPSSILESMQRSSPRLRLIRLNGYFATLKFKSVLSDFIILRALDLNGCGIKVVPDCIGEMKHLRYLNLYNNPFSSLPESFCLLRNMQTLNLGSCYQLSSLPTHIENMRCLVHLDIQGCRSLTSMPVGIGQLTCLRELCTFIVNRKNGSGVVGLQGLNNLRGSLRIKGLHRVETLTEAKEANLMGKKNLHSLELCWDSDLDVYLEDELEFCFNSSSHSDSGSDSESREQQRQNLIEQRRQNDIEQQHQNVIEQQHQNVIEGLQPHSNLRELGVRSYGGVTLTPSWLTEASLLPNLVQISLSNCLNCEHLGSLRKLPRLKVLKLYAMDSLKFIEEEVVDDADDASAGGGGFPSLEELLLNTMPNLEGWSKSSSSSLPQASAEEEEGYPSLEGLSLEEEPMRNLEGSSSQAAAAVFRCLKRKSRMKLERCPKLKRGGGLPFSFSSSSLSQTSPITQQIAAVFPSLKSVTLYECRKLKGVPLAWSPLEDVKIIGWCCNGMVLGSLRDLPSLPSLQICQFHELEYFPSGTLTNLPALHDLEISQCRRLRALPVELYSLASLTELEISHCPNLVSLADEREGGLKNLSSLKTLVIAHCRSLKCLPELHKASLVTLRIEACPEMEFSKGDFEHLIVLEELELYGLPKLTCFPEGIKQSAATLRHLKFQPGVPVDMPDWIGTTLTSLEHLEIQAPKNWKVLPQWMQHLTALKQLYIYGCDEELVEQLKTSDMVSHIPAVEVYPLEDEGVVGIDYPTKRARQTDEPAAQEASSSMDQLPKTVACTLYQGSDVTSIDFHPSRQTSVIVGCGNGEVTLWDIRLREKLVSKPFMKWDMSSSLPFQAAFVKDPLLSTSRVRWSPDGNVIGVAFTKHLIQLYATEGHNDLRQCVEIDAHIGCVNDLAFSYPNKQLCVVSCGDDKQINVWDMTGEKLFNFEGHEAPVYSICPHQIENIQFIYSTAIDGKIKAWLYNNLESRVDYDAPGHGCTTMLYSADGTRLFSCSTGKDGDSFLVEWNEIEGAIKRSYSGFRKKSVGVVQFDTTQNRFLAAGEDHQIKFWDMDNANILTSTDAEGGLPSVPCLRFNKEGNLLAVSTAEKGFKILASFEALGSLRAFESRTFEGSRVPIEPSGTKNGDDLPEVRDLVEIVDPVKCQVVTAPDIADPLSKCTPSCYCCTPT